MKKLLAVFIVIVAIGSFYGGVAFVTSQNNQDAETVIVSAIESAFRSTEHQPVIHIIPKESLFEKSKGLLGFKTEREVVVIQSSEIELLLGLKKAEETGILRSGFDFTADSIKGGWNWTTTSVNNGWQWTKQKFSWSSTD